jgi:signal transduction histidine kinase/CheY-like chemotaxis protein
MIDIRDGQDVVLARQRTRQVAELLGFDAQDQVRLATAVSEVARNALQYAGAGRAEFAADDRQLTVTVRDRGPGIADVRAVLDGRAGGAGLAGARRLVDAFDIESSPGGTVVRLGKELPRHAPPPGGAGAARIASELARLAPGGPLVELQRQNRELLDALGELRDREVRLAEMSSELEATNKGVVALYAELDEKAESLRRASELKTRFLSNMSHEFRTPLNSVLSLSQFLLDRTDGPLTEEQERQVVFIRRAAQALAELVSDLLDLTKVEAGKATVRPAEFAATDLFATLRGLTRPLLTNDAVALVFEDASAIGALYTDEGKVAQVLRNFLSNALKFTERGEVRVSAEGHPDGTVVFAVADTGIGIARADQERIFEEFGQVDSAVQRRVKGTGLGLSLSKRLAELLGGWVTVRSEPGVGSTFFLSIPRRYTAPTAPHGPAGPNRSGPVLVIDDDEIARYLLRTLLEGTRLPVVEAAGGHEGLRRARDDRPCAIFLDLAMPDLSGFEVLDRLKAEPQTRDIPVVVYTSRALTGADRRALEGRTVAVLSKGTGESREAAAKALRAVLAEAGVVSGGAA